MNKLTNEIINHIFLKLGVINKDLGQIYSSISDDRYLLNRKITLVDDSEQEFDNNIWSSKLDISLEKDLRFLLADCSIGDSEYALLISLKDSPEYALYYSDDPSQCLISCNLNGAWIEATMYMQASFLAGMEQMKDLNSPLIENNKYDDLYERLIDFIKYHDEVIE